MKAAERTMVPQAEVRTYYDRPVLKQPVWRWPIPAYFFSGGLAGATSMLAAGARLTGRSGLARRSRLTALAALGASTAFLIADLGRPARFYNMLRVAKPTSPMSVGTWVLAGYGPAAGLAVGSDLLGVLPGVGAVADMSAAGLGAVVATYTAVLVSDTAIPVWREARPHLPFLFASSAAASAGSAALVVAGLTGAAGGPAEVAPARRMALAGGIGELVAGRAMEQGLGPLGEPYRSGQAGRLMRAAKGLTGGGVAVMAVAGRRRAGAVLGGLMVAAGSALTRFALLEAGKQSAADPKYVVGPQRERMGRTPA